MGLPVSKKEFDRLGDRLRDAPVLQPEDLRLLEAIRPHYLAALERVRTEIATMGLGCTHREKNRDTIIEKLRREREMRLSRVQDIVGARVVRDMTLAEQDQLTAALAARFRDSRVRDRRLEPSHGYRAVHLITKLDGIPVEIQVRTELQHVWAQTMERLGDRWGRAIRYGGDAEAPDREHLVPTAGPPKSRQAWVEIVKDLSSRIAADEASHTVSLLEIRDLPGQWTARQLLDSLYQSDL
jgi:Region found in RelA / SpoT proteins